MSIATEIARIAGLRDTIRSKLLDFGIITNDSVNLSDCATAIDGISESVLTVPSVSISPSMSIASSTGIVTASGSGSGTVSASKGYSKGTSGAVNASASNTLQLPTQAAQTITPGTSNKTIAAGRWLTGAQTIKGDSNLIAANIKSGTSIFGVSGSFPQSLKTSYTVEKMYHAGSDYDLTWRTMPVTIPLYGITPYALTVRIPYLRANCYSFAPPIDNVLTVYSLGYPFITTTVSTSYKVKADVQQCVITNSQITVNFQHYCYNDTDTTAYIYIYIAGI